MLLISCLATNCSTKLLIGNVTSVTGQTTLRKFQRLNLQEWWDGVEMPQDRGEGPGGGAKEVERTDSDRPNEGVVSVSAGEQDCTEGGAVFSHRTRTLDDPPATRDAAFDTEKPGTYGTNDGERSIPGMRTASGEGLRERRRRRSSILGDITSVSSVSNVSSNMSEIDDLSSSADGPSLHHLIRNLSTGVLFFADPGMEENYRKYQRARSSKKSMQYYNIALGLLVVWIEVVLVSTVQRQTAPLTSHALLNGSVSWGDFGLRIASAFNRKFNLSLKIVVLVVLTAHTLAFRRPSPRSLPVALTLSGQSSSRALSLLILTLLLPSFARALACCLA